MEEEFQESDIIFLDDDHHRHDHRAHNYREMIMASHADSQFTRSNSISSDNEKTKRKKKKKMKTSFPVNIPQNIFHFADSDFEEDEYYNDDDYDGEFVPPHVILGRRIAGKMEFSVCTGNGRTLKGRDLRQVRNSILKLTGFLET